MSVWTQYVNISLTPARLASMTASVSCFSILQGLATACELLHSLRIVMQTKHKPSGYSSPGRLDIFRPFTGGSLDAANVSDALCVGYSTHGSVQGSL